MAFKHWPPMLNHVAFNLHGGYLFTYLPCKVVNLVHNVQNHHQEKPPKWFEKWNGKTSTMLGSILGRKFLNHHCFPLHETLVSFQWDLPCQQNHEWFVSCENHPKLNQVVGVMVLSTQFLVVIEWLINHCCSHNPNTIITTYLKILLSLSSFVFKLVCCYKFIIQLSNYYISLMWSEFVVQLSFYFLFSVLATIDYYNALA